MVADLSRRLKVVGAVEVVVLVPNLEQLVVNPEKIEAMRSSQHFPR